MQAGILEEREGGAVTEAILPDELITERQKQVLLEIYDSFRRENEVRAPASGLPADADLGVTEEGTVEWAVEAVEAVEAGVIDTVEAERVLSDADMAAAELADQTLITPPAGQRRRSALRRHETPHRQGEVHSGRPAGGPGGQARKARSVAAATVDSDRGAAEAG